MTSSVRAGVGLGLALLTLATVAHAADEAPPAFFDPLVTTAPGISRELGVLFDHGRSRDDRLTQPSLRLQYPVLPWLQFSLEVPYVIHEHDDARASGGLGDLLLVGQARVLTSNRWPAEIDIGIEQALPTGDHDALGGGTTAVRPFVAAGTRLASFDVLASLSYQWIVEGPIAPGQMLLASVAVGRAVGPVTPFAELSVLDRVQGAGDHRPQIAILPGLELYATRNLSLSIGVQLPLTSARAAEQRVLGFLRWGF